MNEMKKQTIEPDLLSLHHMMWGYRFARILQAANQFDIFTILSDPDRDITGKYEALKSDSKSIQRIVYVVGPEQKIIFAEEGMPADQKILDAIEKNKA